MGKQIIVIMEIVEIYEKIEYKCMKEFQTTPIERSVVFTNIIEQFRKYIKANDKININLNDYIEQFVDLKRNIKEAQRVCRKEIKRDKIPSFLWETFRDAGKDILKQVIYFIVFVILLLVGLSVFKIGNRILSFLKVLIEDFFNK